MIRESLFNWKNSTEKLLLILNEQHSDETRENIIQQVETLLDTREELQKTIQPPFTDKEKEFGKELILLEKNLDTKLNLFLDEIRKGMQMNNKKKVTVNAYLNPYNQVFRDGTFYDKKE